MPGPQHQSIDENDAVDSFLACRNVPDPAGTDTDEHLHKVRAAQEKTASWPRRPPPWRAGSCPCPEGPPMRLWNLGAEVGVLRRVLQKLHDFTQFLLRTVQSSHILEVDLGGILLVEELRLGLADVEDLASTSTASSEAAHEHHPHAHHDSKHNDVEQQLLAPFVGALVGHRHHAVCRQLIEPVDVLFRRRNLHDEVRTLNQPTAEGAVPCPS